MIARLSALSVLGVLLSAQQPNGRDVNFYSKEKEAALGVSLAREVQKYTSAIADLTVHDYIERIGRQLAAKVPNGDLDWKLAVVRDDVGGSTHEPLSVPGGHIFVSTSLILAVENEAELAGMLAHSMAHIAERHGTRMAARGQAATLSSIPLVFMGGWMGIGAAGNDDRAFVPVGYLRIQRSNELDADRVGVNIMAAAGYDPVALVDYIRRTQRALTTESRVYSALPPREERISALETAVANLTYTGQPGGEFKAIQDRVRELIEPPLLRRKNQQ